MLISIGAPMVAMEASRPLDQFERAQRETIQAFETMENDLTAVRRAGKIEFLTRKVLENKLSQEQIRSAQRELSLLKNGKDLQRSKKLLMYSWIGAPFIGIITYLLGRVSH